ncbi:MAG: TlpA disulfide reductase family protein [Breznakibacter sp.]
MTSKINVVIFPLLVLVMAIACAKQEKGHVTVKLHLGGYPDTSGIYLEELRSRYVPFDTAIYVKEGQFVFDNPVEKESFFRIRVGNDNIFAMILKPGQTTTIVADVDNLSANPTVMDNAETKAMLDARQIALDYQTDLQRIVAVFNDTTRLRPLLPEKDSLVALSDRFLLSRKKQLQVLLDNRKESLAALPILLQTAGNRTFFAPQVDRQIFIDVDNYLIRNYSYQAQVRNFHYRLDSAFAAIDSTNAARIGDKMPEPTGRTIWKESLPISKFRGKPLLVFVWTSYDDLCQKEIPNIKRLWETYNPKGLEVYVVSMDSTETIWRNAIDQYRLACFHINDLNGENSPTIRDLGIRSLPASFLVNKEGVIVEKNVWGTLLEDAIKNQLGK